MSLFKTNFMKLVEAYLQDKGFTVEMCNIYTRNVDFYESYKRVIMCAYKDDLLLTIRARSGEASDPFKGTDDQIEAKLQEPALKLLSCVLSLNSGMDPIYCDKFKGMKAVPVIIMEKSSRNHPLYYYFDGDARESKIWYKKKNVVYLPWDWLQEFWNEDFRLSLMDQGYEVSEPIEHEPEIHIKQAITEIEEVLASRRIGIMKSVHLDKPTLPPLALTLTQNDQMMIFVVDEPDDSVHPKLMDFAVYHFGTKIDKFPTTVKAIFFNISIIDKDKSYMNPYVPKDNKFVEDHFEHPIVIKTTTKGFKLLLEAATIEELSALPQLSPISNLEMSSLLKTSSGYWFTKVFNEAKKKLKNFYSSKCPYCSNTSIVHQVPNYAVSHLNLDLKLTKENSYVVYCDDKRNGCGLGFIIVKDKFQGGIHGFFVGGDQQYAHEVDNARRQIQSIGLKAQSFVHIKQ